MKKRFVRLLVSVVLLLLILPVSLTAYAANYKEEKIAEMEKALDISTFQEEGMKHTIKTFDVNDDGWYAIAYNGWVFAGSNDNVISVYNSLGEFQYGFTFDAVGDYGVDLLENNVILYLARSNALVEIDSTGKCVNGEPTRYANLVGADAYYRTSKQVGSVCYSLERDIGLFAGHYSRLVRTDAAGNEMILHDVTIWGYFVGTFHWIFFSFFFVAPVIVIFKKDKKRKAGQEKAAPADNNEPQNS